MDPPPPPPPPPAPASRAACKGLLEAMDAMCDDPGFRSFRPSVARAIASLRDDAIAARATA